MSSATARLLISAPLSQPPPGLSPPFFHIPGGVCHFPSHALMQRLLCFWYSWWRGCCSPLQSQTLLQSHPIPTQALPPCTPLPWQQALYHCSVPCPGCPFLQPVPNNPLVTRTSPVKKNGRGGLNLLSPGCLPGAWPHKAPSSGR